jgi:hypothetical protein
MYIENIDHFVDEEKVEDTNEVARSHTSKDKPSPEWDVFTITTIHIKKARKKISVYDKLILNLLEVSKVEVIPMLQLCSKYYTKILCRGEICTHRTHIHDRSLYRLCT